MLVMKLLKELPLVVVNGNHPVRHHFELSEQFFGLRAERLTPVSFGQLHILLVQAFKIGPGILDPTEVTLLLVLQITEHAEAGSEQVQIHFIRYRTGRLLHIDHLF